MFGSGIVVPWLYGRAEAMFHPTRDHSVSDSSTNATTVRPLRHPAFWVGAAPLLCALHCLATPMVVLLAPTLAPMREAEAILLGICTVLSIGFAAEGVRRHGRYGIWLPIAAGLVLWTASLAGWLAPLPEAATTVVGSVATAAGLFRNATLRHRATCNRCGCVAHG